jgi:hypothetical protein
MTLAVLCLFWATLRSMAVLHLAFITLLRKRACRLFLFPFKVFYSQRFFSPARAGQRGRLHHACITGSFGRYPLDDDFSKWLVLCGDMGSSLASAYYHLILLCWADGRWLPLFSARFV